MRTAKGEECSQQLLWGQVVSMPGKERNTCKQSANGSVIQVASWVLF